MNKLKLSNNLSIDNIIDAYERRGYYSEQLDVIRNGLEKGFDVSISDGLRLGLDVSQYADPSIPFTEMRMIKSRLFNDKLRGDANEVDK